MQQRAPEYTDHENRDPACCDSASFIQASIVLLYCILIVSAVVKFVDMHWATETSDESSSDCQLLPWLSNQKDHMTAVFITGCTLFVAPPALMVAVSLCYRISHACVYCRSPECPAPAAESDRCEARWHLDLVLISLPALVVYFIELGSTLDFCVNGPPEASPL